MPVKEKGRERQKKSDNDTERAHDSSNRHTKCGSSLPVSIPKLDDSFVQVYVVQIAPILSVHHFPFRRSFWSGAWRCLSHIESKVGPQSCTFFSLYVPGANPSCFGAMLGFIGCAYLSGQDCICISLMRTNGHHRHNNFLSQ